MPSVDFNYDTKKKTGGSFKDSKDYYIKVLMSKCNNTYNYDNFRNYKTDEKNLCVYISEKRFKINYFNHKKLLSLQ